MRAIAVRDDDAEIGYAPKNPPITSVAPSAVSSRFGSTRSLSEKARAVTITSVKATMAIAPEAARSSPKASQGIDGSPNCGACRLISPMVSTGSV